MGVGARGRVDWLAGVWIAGGLIKSMCLAWASDGAWTGRWLWPALVSGPSSLVSGPGIFLWLLSKAAMGVC